MENSAQGIWPRLGGAAYAIPQACDWLLDCRSPILAYGSQIQTGIGTLCETKFLFFTRLYVQEYKLGARRATMREKPDWDQNNTEMDRAETQTKTAPSPKMLFTHLINLRLKTTSVSFASFVPHPTPKNGLIHQTHRSVLLSLWFFLEIILSYFLKQLIH